MSYRTSKTATVKPYPCLTERVCVGGEKWGVCLCSYVCVCMEIKEEASDPLELRVQMVVSYLTQVPGRNLTLVLC